jgi:hypothetical protein
LRSALNRAARPLNGLTPDNEGRGMVLAGDLTPSMLDAGGARFAMASR